MGRLMRGRRKLLPALFVALAVLLAACDLNVTGRQEWEYLILSPGVIYTSPPDADSLPEADRAKYLEAFPSGNDGYRIAGPANIGRFTAQLDALGRQGWELISIVGQIGGDQQFVFKRPKR